jgi:hypothetical protein
MILARKLKHAWEVVDLLIWLHLGDSFWLHGDVSPVNVPIFHLLVGVLAHILGGESLPPAMLVHLLNWLEAEAEVEQLFRHKSDYKVLGGATIKHQFAVLIKFRVVIIIFHTNCLRINFHFLVDFLLFYFFF